MTVEFKRSLAGGWMHFGPWQVRSFSVLSMLPVWAIRVRACAMLGLAFSGMSLT
jgi:hypothetical protein